jgi:hypothetical protein
MSLAKLAPRSVTGSIADEDAPRASGGDERERLTEILLAAKGPEGEQISLRRRPGSDLLWVSVLLADGDWMVGHVDAPGVFAFEGAGYQFVVGPLRHGERVEVTLSDEAEPALLACEDGWLAVAPPLTRPTTGNVVVHRGTAATTHELELSSTEELERLFAE